jgi:ubiquinone/menaquinone biosynthesis C-methylase UbiE
MNPYIGFARVYDELMSNIPYEKWGSYINNELRKRLAHVKEPLVVDLACGTGTMTLLLANMGFDMIGVDLSIDMLAKARQKADEAKRNILFLAQDMRKLDLFGTVDAVVSVCDGINYILQPEELNAVFKGVKTFLNPGGVFIFDMNTEFKFKELLGSRIFEAKAESGAAYEWENFYDESTKINEYRVLFFKHENAGESDSFEEIHKQRAYSTEDVKRRLKVAGFINVTVRHFYSHEPPRYDSPRLTYIAEV